ncbi:MAG: BON domain-containing protein [Deltaproteobacteria bacterium]|jgi:hyperosmotically inducible protein
MISREQLKKDVVDQLYWDDRVDAAQVEVEVKKEGHVRLSGIVPNITAYRAAETDSLAVRGVKAVNNELQIRQPSDLVLDDAEIKTSIIGALTWYPDIDASRIEVSVEKSSVTLAGIVDSYWKKIKAEELAFDTAGVAWVVNELAVVPSKSIADETIAREIIRALERNSDILDPDRINVTVEKGMVTLSGNVSGWRAMTAAESAARYTPGVVNVFSSLVVEQKR